VADVGGDDGFWVGLSVVDEALNIHIGWSGRWKWREIGIEGLYRKIVRSDQKKFQDKSRET